MAEQIGEAISAWEDLGPTQRSPLSALPPRPSARTVEIMGKLGLRYPPASSVDRDAHAARVALLAEDCADLDPEWLDYAAREWAKAEPFMPRACEIRDVALAYGRSLTRGRALPAPVVEIEPAPTPEPLTEDELRRLPKALVDMGVKLGEITREQAARLNTAT